MFRTLLISVFCTVLLSGLYGQGFIIDEVIAVVGDKKVQYADIEKQYLQFLAQEMVDDDQNMRCLIFEELLTQMLLINQAEVDSIEVGQAQVEAEIDNRMQYYINQLGSEEKLEQLFQKSIIEMKEEFRDIIRDQLMAQQMRREIVKDVTVTPSEVRKFYKDLPSDSLPYIDAQVEISQILLYPPSGEQSELEVRERLLSLRQRIIDGENFATLAVLYSEDPGSAPKGGDIGFMHRGSLDTEYAKAAMALKSDQVSRIVQSGFGYHIIQLLNREGDRIHTRHILMKPKISLEDRLNTKFRLDSIIQFIQTDSLTFEEAARQYSMDEATRLSGGRLVNPNTNGLRFELDQFDSRDFVIINRLKPGQISEAYETTDTKGKSVYKAVMLTRRTLPHLANLNEDYDLFKQAALQQKENEMLETWIKDKIKVTYIRIDEKYKSCPFHLKEWIK